MHYSRWKKFHEVVLYLLLLLWFLMASTLSVVTLKFFFPHTEQKPELLTNTSGNTLYTGRKENYVENELFVLLGGINTMNHRDDIIHGVSCKI